jgi:hypothetical protein
MRLLRFLPLLALLPLPLAAAADLEWHVQVVSGSKYAPLEFVAQLRNVGKEKVTFKAEGDRPAVELLLEAAGKEPIRKPLPKEVAVYKGPSVLEMGQYGWYATGDLRRAFGRLAPGRYALRVSLGGVVSAAAEFEVIDTSVEEARKAWTAPEGIEFRVKAPGVGVLTNRRKEPIGVWAYGGDRKDRPLDAMVTAQQWTGRAWQRFGGGFCGTGLEEVTLAPGAEREVSLPAMPDGILRLSVSCFERKGDKVSAIEAVSEPMLVDTFEG